MTIDEDPDRLDAAAATLSSLCLLHCLALPLALVLLPTAGGALRGSLHGPGWLHWALIALAAPFSVWALWRGVAVHGRNRFWRWALAGFALMAAGALLHAHAPAEQMLTVAGGLVVAGAHWGNWRARRG